MERLLSGATRLQLLELLFACGLLEVKELLAKFQGRAAERPMCHNRKVEG